MSSWNKKPPSKIISSYKYIRNAKERYEKKTIKKKLSTYMKELFPKVLKR